MSVRYIKGRACYPLPTVYTLDYRWPPFQEVIRRKEGYEIEKTRPQYSKEEAETLLYRLYSSRLRTTYDVSYTLPLSKRTSVGGKEEEEISEDFGDETDNMMMQFKRTYWADVCPLPRPDLLSTAKVFGPSRSEYRLVGLSEYQDHLGRIGYDKLLEREKDEKTRRKAEKNNGGKVNKVRFEG